MSTETFTTEETSRDTRGSFTLLVRLLWEAPFMLGSLIPVAVAALVTTGGYQIFVWMSGLLAECPGKETCPAATLGWGIEVVPDLSTLILLALVIVSVRIAQWIVFEVGGQLALRGLFRKMVKGLGHVRTTFFDEYPSGKIINRVINDTDELRSMGPMRIGDTVTSLVELIVAAAVISFASPVAALVTIPIFALFVYIQRNVAPMLQRLVILRSARFGEVLHRETDVIEGVRCFVLYDQIPALMGRVSDSVYRFMQTHFLRGRIEAWGRCISEMGVAVFGSIVLAAVSIGIQSGRISQVLGVVIISVAFRLGTVFHWLSWSIGMLFEIAGHARRVFEYVDLPHEESEEGQLPNSEKFYQTPMQGDLTFEGYSMSYRATTPAILRDLSVKIRQGSKVGLIGRTGAGKSSMVQALFRMVYVRGGDIRIGETSLLGIPVEQARALFAVVPQDPYLFEGTIRSNIDRLGEFSDGEVETALRTVRLSFPLGMQLREGGSNLSLGQRQLLCLARVILSKRPVVVMDEPTSGVDTITDAIVQNVLRTSLRDRTIITVAHRLETLARFDRIIELEDGAIIRDGTPAEIVPRITPEELA